MAPIRESARRGLGVVDSHAPRPRKTRAHVIASQSYNHIERLFVDKGHAVARPSDDYGFDLLVNTFDDEGYAENGEILIQLKAGDGLDYSADGSSIAFRVDVRHYELWLKEPMPVFLMLYDARLRTAYWLYVQDYFRSDPTRKPRAGAKTITVRVPVANEFTEATVDYARERKRLILAQIEGEVEHRG